MSFYAHAVIEVDGTKYQRGDAVPDDVAGFDELVDAGAVSDEEYDASAEPVQTPEEVEINGVKYVKASDSGDNGEVSNA
jgi:hypothetical protein